MSHSCCDTSYQFIPTQSHESSRGRSDTTIPKRVKRVLTLACCETCGFEFWAGRGEALFKSVCEAVTWFSTSGISASKMIVKHDSDFQQQMLGDDTKALDGCTRHHVSMDQRSMHQAILTRMQKPRLFRRFLRVVKAMFDCSRLVLQLRSMMVKLLDLI